MGKKKRKSHEAHRPEERSSFRGLKNEAKLSSWLKVTQQFKPRNANQVFRCLLASITISIYLNSLNCGFVYDDRRAILENQNVVGHQNGQSGWLGLLTDDFWGTPIGLPGSHKSYRPLVTLTFRLQARLAAALNWPPSSGGDAQESSAFAYHLVNLLLHLCVVDLVFRLACKLSSGRRLETECCRFSRAPEAEDCPPAEPVAWACSLLFACHPIHVEAVTSLVGRAELMGALFALHSFDCLIRHLAVTVERQRQRQTGSSRSASSGSKLLVLSTLFAMLAALSKENYISVIGINLLLIAWHALRPKCPGRQRLEVSSLAAMVGVLAAYAAIRIQLNSSLALVALAAQDTAGSDSLGANINFNDTAVSSDEEKEQPSGWWANFGSNSDNPLAASPRQFCLRHPNELGLSSQETNGAKQLEQICSNQNFLDQLGGWILSTKLYLPIFSLKLLANPRELSYDWPLSSIGLVKSRLELRFLLAMSIYLCLFLFLIKWLGQLLLFGQNLALKEPFDRSTVASGNRKEAEEDECNSEHDCSQSEIHSDSETSSVHSMDTIRSSDSGFGEFPSPASGKQLIKETQAGEKALLQDHRKQRPNASRRTDFDALGWSIIWLVVPYLPASNLLVPVGFLVAERTLYLPSFGFCLLLASLLNQLVAARNFGLPGSERARLLLSKPFGKFPGISGQDRSRMSAKLLLLLPLLISSALKTVDRNLDWQSERSLYTSNLEQSPAKSLANLASLVESTASSDFSRQERLYRAALEREPHSAELHYNLALALQRAKLGQASPTGRSHNNQHHQPGRLDPIEYHYKLALSLRPNFALAALNLAAYQYESLHQLVGPWRTFEHCGLRMSPKATRAFHQHVQVQIECLISGAKLALNEMAARRAGSHGAERQTNGPPTEQTTPAVDRQAGGSSGSGGSSSSGTEIDTIGRLADCPRVLEWMVAARRLAGQIEWPTRGPLDVEHQFGDLSKQMATIHWIRAQCDDSQAGGSLASTGASTPAAGELSGEAREAREEAELRLSVGFALRSRNPISASVYTSLADLLARSAGGRRAGAAVELLSEALDVERRKPGWRANELARLHFALAKLVARPAEALEQARLALRLQPDESDFLSLAARLAYETGEPLESEQLYARALAKLSERQREHVSGRKLAAAHSNYGAILQVNGRIEEARKQYRRALDCDPENAAARVNLRRLPVLVAM